MCIAIHITVWLTVASYAVADSNETVDSCPDGLIVPAWHPSDNLTMGDRVFRGSVYFFFMLYLFLGVSIISDRFMQAIEVITSQEKKVSIKSKEGKKVVLVRVWNETVANLTLMALGSSAPEILLSIIEIWAKNFEAGDLGPGTIVGSAAYNLFVIIAICVYVVPDGEIRRIKQINVFFVTATWSVFAYIWLYIILAVTSAGVVEVWEGVLTFIFFPLTVLSAYIVDRRIPIHKLPLKLFKCKSHSAVGAAENIDIEMARSDTEGFEEMLEHARQQSANLLKELRREFPEKTMAELKAIAQEKMEQSGPKSRAFYRIQATRSITGGSLIQRPTRESSFEEKHELFEEKTCVRFDKSEYSVLENVGTLVVKVILDGPGINVPVLVDYESEDGTAQAGSDYIAVSGTLTFKPGFVEQAFKIKIIDDDVFEKDEHFFIRLTNVRLQGAKTSSSNSIPNVNLGEPNVTKILILDDDHSGEFGFSEPSVNVMETVGTYEVVVERKTGARGRVNVPYHTCDGTAKAGKDYMEAKGVLVFDNNESRKIIPVRIISENSYERQVSFTMHLGRPQIEMSINPLKVYQGKLNMDAEKVAKEGMPVLSETNILMINIRESLEFKDTVDSLVETRASPFIVGTTSWRDQFSAALRASPEEESGSASGMDCCIHAFTLPWKIIFAFVPPTAILHGWICFSVSITCIGFLTAIIGDVATSFGCTAGISDQLTAISLVALGTSLPDTFASKTSAIQDATADNSVGNVTGSNAVNVFLGIGIAWSIAALYHACNGRSFVVPPGNLAFSVTIFCTEALVAIAIILYRRTQGGELGGTRVSKRVTSSVFVSLWLLYLILSTLEAYGVIKGF